MQKIPLPPKEQIVQYYITDMHTKKECLQYFNVSSMTFSKWLHEYNIIKTLEDIQKQNLARYGTTCACQTEQAKHKRQQTCLQKYGVLNVGQSPEIQAKMAKTCLEKYGCKTALESPEIQEKARQTCLNNYGVSNIFASEEFQERMVQKNLEDYGVTSLSQINIHHYDIWNNYEKFKQLLTSKKEKFTIRELSIYFNCCYQAVKSRLQKYGLLELVQRLPSRSQYENELIQFLNSLGITNIALNDRSVLQRKEIDIYLPEYSLGIEFNGDYWHSDAIKNDEHNNKYYHQVKSLEAKTQNVFIFHIFQHEWDNIKTQNILKRMITNYINKNTLKDDKEYIIRKLTNKEKRDFFNLNHLEGDINTNYNLGLFDDNNLIASMGYQINLKDCSCELRRFSSIANLDLFLVFKLLMQKFIQDNPHITEIHILGDFGKDNWMIYERFGFECLEIKSPQFIRMNFNNNQVVQSTENLSGQNFHRVYNSGYQHYIFKVNN